MALISLWISSRSSGVMKVWCSSEIVSCVILSAFFSRSLTLRACARSRKDDGNGGAVPLGGVRSGDLQPRIMAQQHMLDDGEAETGAAGSARTAAVDTVKTFGEARQMLRRDALAVIDHAKGRHALVEPPENADLTAIGGVAHRIDDQIAHCAGQLVAIAGQPTALAEFADNPVVSL